MTLIKLGPKEHMEQFRSGLLYMNTLSYFRDLEADPARGDRLVLITGTPEFSRRIVRAAEEQKLQVSGKLVEYYDDKSYSGKVGRFKKSSKCAHQNEFRVAIEAGVKEPSRFKSGDTHGITSELIPSDRANELLKFT